MVLTPRISMRPRANGVFPRGDCFASHAHARAETHRCSLARMDSTILLLLQVAVVQVGRLPTAPSNGAKNSLFMTTAF